MSKVKFLLDKPSSDKETLILMIFRYDNKTVKWSTGERILPRDWNNELQRVRKINKIPHQLINDWLDTIEHAVIDIHKNFRNNFASPSANEFKKVISTKFTLSPKKECSVDFFSFLTELIRKKKSGEVLKKDGSVFSESTIDLDYQMLTYLKKIESELNYPIRFNTINDEFFDKFVRYCHDDNKAQNTIDSIICKLKSYLRHAIKDGLFEEANIKTLKRQPYEKVENIALYEDSLNTLFELDLSDKPSLENVRDLFLIGCYTCLRFSDFSILDTPHFDDGFIRITDKKTSTKLVIPMHPVVKSILQRRQNVLPYSVSNNQMNKLLKKLGELAGLDKEIIKTEKRGGKMQKKTYKQYELITTHTARRSGATNMILAGIPENVVMVLTGHSTVASFRKYVKVTKEQTARYLLDHEYFKEHK